MSVWSWMSLSLRPVGMGLLLAFAIAGMTITIAAWWQRSIEVQHLLQRQETLSEILQNTNAICEGRLNRMQGIYEQTIDRYEALVATLQEDRKRLLEAVLALPSVPLPP